MDFEKIWILKKKTLKKLDSEFHPTGYGTILGMAMNINELGALAEYDARSTLLSPVLEFAILNVRSTANCEHRWLEGEAMRPSNRTRSNLHS